jgi:hypothetical protein
MSNWKVWRLLILLLLLGVFAWTLYTRGIPGRFGGQQPASLQTHYQTERDWAIRETTLDIEEMAAYAAGRQVNALRATPATTPWDTTEFTVLATMAFGSPATLPSHTVDAVDVYPALTALDVPVLVESSRTVSDMLAANMRNARAHESAALIIGAFALRDAADLFTDVRWALNRMTAHLAVAAALRADDQRSPDGSLANVILLALANHQARAMVALDALGTGTPPEPMNAWVRALRMRITQDWRVLPDPASATRLEKLEFFRAKRQAVKRERAAQHLAQVAEPMAADFARIAQNNGVGVEDGHEFLRPALDFELEEAARAYQRVHGRPFPASLAEALNHRSSRLIANEPHVLGWGTWAEFYQRHIAMTVGMVDSYERHMLGRPADADARKREMSTRVGDLTLFPVGTIRWTKGSEGTEADLAYLSDVVELAARAPEMLSAPAWKWFEHGVAYEPVATGMPSSANWFVRLTPSVPFETGRRFAEAVGAADDPDALLTAAPHDLAFMAALARRGPTDPGVARARGLLELRHDYDLRALDASLALAATEDARMPLRRKACAISSRDCVQLASSLLHHSGDEAGAAAIYEQAFADPFMDAIARAADSYWLVTYYHRNQQPDKARALAEEVAQTGSGSGYYTRARLNERLGNLDAAEEDFLINAERYKNFEGLLGFYYRRVEVDRMTAYVDKWDRWRAEVFPEGLQPEPTDLTGVPPTGVFVEKDTELSRAAGIRAGDIIVGLEGWRVDSVPQYRVINFFTDDPNVKLTISRGGQLIKVEAKSPSRLFGTAIQTHPMTGWIKD